jgi:hypothetical protein
MKKMIRNLFVLMSFSLVLFGCSESDYTSPLSPTTVNNESARESRAIFSWTKGVVGYNFYTEDSPATSYFTGTGVPSSGTSILDVEWDYNVPPSGEFSSVTLQYTRPYSSYVSISKDITDSLVGSTDMFNGESAKGQISIEFISTGGVYPLRRTLKDTVIVTYED